jgi:hypothetical protein
MRYSNAHYIRKTLKSRLPVTADLLRSGRLSLTLLRTAAMHGLDQCQFTYKFAFKEEKFGENFFANPASRGAQIPSLETHTH